MQETSFDYSFIYSYIPGKNHKFEMLYEEMADRNMLGDLAVDIPYDLEETQNVRIPAVIVFMNMDLDDVDGTGVKNDMEEILVCQCVCVNFIKDIESNTYSFEISQRYLFTSDSVYIPLVYIACLSTMSYN